MATGIFLVARWVFGIPIRGDVSALFLATLLYVFTLLSVGLLISVWAQNHMQALQMSMALILPAVFFSGFIFPIETMPRIFQWLSTLIPAVFFSGFIFPIETMPRFFQWISTLIPATYFIELMRAIMLRGASVDDYWLNFVVLAGMGLVLFSLCALRFKQKIA
jgi:ABC-2 type transport system permease protein